MTEVEHTIRDYIVREIMFAEDVSKLPVDHPLLDSGSIDSFGMQRLIAFLEEHYDLTVDDGSLTRENFEHVRAIARLVERLRR
jgi:acyl carrier protein